MRGLLETGFTTAAGDQIGNVTCDTEVAARHVATVLAIPYVDVDAIRRRRFKVALDCVRGAGATVMPALLAGLGGGVVAINMERDGRFPREPEPIPENLSALEALVKESGADIGMAVD